jgi:hypothetical protein
MARTTADVPPNAASEFSKAPRPSAVADATGSPGYTETKAMQKGKTAGKSKGQFGLPKSPGKGPPMQMGGNPGVHLKIRVMPDDQGM